MSVSSSKQEYWNDFHWFHEASISGGFTRPSHDEIDEFQCEIKYWKLKANYQTSETQNILFLSGWGESITKYAHAIKFLHEKKYNVYAMVC